MHRAAGPPKTVSSETLTDCIDATGSVSAKRAPGSVGFDLHAGLVVPAGQRERLERVCRYTLSPPVTQERLRMTGEGQVRLQLRQPWADAAACA